MTLWDQSRICGPSVTVTLLCGTWLYSTGIYTCVVHTYLYTWWWSV